jgi:stress response protein SCP2
MSLLARGQKVKLADLSSSLQLLASVGATSSSLSFDISCFGLDHNARLSDDRYFVFYNQPASPEGALRIVPAQGDDTQTFDLDLSRLPASIQRLVFVLTIDGEGTMNQLETGYFRLEAGGQEVARFPLVGQDFQSEKAVMVAEIYLKDVWRVAAVGQGFAGGLTAVLQHFGGQEVEEVGPEAETVTPTSPAPSAPEAAPLPETAAHTETAAFPEAAPKVSLGKDERLQLTFEKSAPHLVALSRPLAVSLQKAGLQEVRARVALVLDASGSMRQQYRDGAVQAVVSRIATLALRLDDDGELDVWAFAVHHARLPSVTLDTIRGYVKGITHDAAKNCLIGELGGTNNEPPVIQEVLDFYRDSTLPALVVFISDGGVKSSLEIKRLITEASAFPIFWQFVGLGGRNYGILEQLDTMEGRTVDNANFFHVDDLADITDEELYTRLLGEFPIWLREAKRLGLAR